MEKYFTNDFRNTEITGGFWKRRQDINRKTTIHAVKDRFLETGRFEALNMTWKQGMPNMPHIFWDSDIAKWIESAAFILEKNQDDDLVRQIDEAVDSIVENQGEDGYFNIYFTVAEPEQRWQRRVDHELYCAGHLIEAAVAYFKVSGKDKFLRAMCKYADYIEKVFVIDKSAAFTTPGHEEIELALVKLYEVTKEKRYLDLSKFFIDNRGVKEEAVYDGLDLRALQSHLPVREQETAEGHCVRALYLYSGMADLAYEYDDKTLFDACKTLYKDIVYKKMYVTGGVGSTHLSEAFTIPYDLPNMQAYAESCAAISMVFFANRMLKLEADSTYADTIERVIYNGFLSSVSLDGKSFFYENPLEIDPKLINKGAKRSAISCA